MLLLLMVAIGGYVGVQPGMLATGLPLLVLGTVLSTYLGLMVTHGLRWIETTLGIGVMVALMTLVWVVASGDANFAVVLTLEALLAVLALFLRSAARRRWIKIDWMQSRLDRALVARGA